MNHWHDTEDQREARESKLAGEWGIVESIEYTHNDSQEENDLVFLKTVTVSQLS